MSGLAPYRSPCRGFVATATLLLLLIALLAGAPPAHAGTEGPWARTPHVQARLVADTLAPAPGGRFTVGLHKRIAPGWHTYWLNPGDSGIATEVDWHLPSALQAGPLQWPAPQRQPFGPVMNYGYEGEVTLLTEFAVAADARPGDVLTLQANADWLVCSDICIPEQLTLTLALPLADPAQPAAHPAIRAAQGQLPQPAPWPARYAQTADGTLTLEVATGPLPDTGAALWFFPQHWGQLDHAAAQPLRLTAEGVRLQLAAGPALGQPAPARLEGVLVIEDRARPGGQRSAYALEATRVDALPPATIAAPASPAAVSQVGIAQALLGALLGGLILNLMPCVFPVLAMKVMALLQHSHGTPGRLRLHGLAYLGGVLASFALLAGVVLALQAGGALLGWGFQFQSPLFVLLVAWLLFAVGLNLSGVFNLGGGALAGVGQRLAERRGIAGSFFTGVLAAVVATPCTAPFMGVAIGFAMTQPPAVLATVFLALGFGLALPFVALAWHPAWLRRLPRPGVWMLHFKQFLAFPMYGAAVWLLWVLALQTGADGVLLATAGMVVLALAAWLYENARHATAGLRRLARGTGLGLLALTLTGGVHLIPPPANPPSPAETARPGTGAPPHLPYSAERVAELRAQGRPVFVNFTAAWCITCLVNERVALNQPAVASAFERLNVAYLKGDWTNQDHAITEVLTRYGRSGVPLYLYYPPDGTDARVLPQILTPDIVLQAIEARTGG